MYYKKDEILDNISIGYILQDKGFELLRESKNYKVNCIFHNDKSPSLSIEKETGFFYCYGCKKKGDFINLLEKYESKSFKEVLEDLSKNYYKKQGDLDCETGIKGKIRKEYIQLSKKGIETNHMTKSEEEYKIIEYITKYWERNIPSDIKNKYLMLKKEFSYQIYNGNKLMNGYGFTKSIIKEFRIGYSENNTKLFKLLIEEFGENILNKYLINNKYFGIFDNTKKPIFKNMIIFPIIINGKVETFIGRQTECTPANMYNTAKYVMQSGERNFLYNEKSFQEDIIIITEGITDCIKLEQHKHKSIALITTSLKKSLQKNVIHKLKDKRVFIIFDNEINLSGNNGANILDKLLKNSNIDSTIISLPLKKGEEKIDINKFINIYGIKQFNKLISPYVL